MGIPRFPSPPELDGPVRFSLDSTLAMAKVKTSSQKQGESLQLERHEAKYLIRPEQIPAIREFIRPFVLADDNAEGPLPQYLVTTLQLDSPSLALYKAKEIESINRFKLRVRTYGTDRKCPVFMEVKRKIKGVIVKSRVTIPFDRWHRGAACTVDPTLRFRSDREAANYVNFVRLVREIGAEPIVLIRYTRESYLGRNDQYSRLTFDSKLMYRPCRSWELLPEGGHWFSMDSAMAHNRTFSGVILELKTFGDAPLWMVDLTERFDLVRVGFCKYYTAVRLESLFRGQAYSDGAETVTFW